MVLYAPNASSVGHGNPCDNTVSIRFCILGTGNAGNQAKFVKWKSRMEVNPMDHNQVLELEEACERAIVEVLRKHYPHEVLHRVRHLMAKAAVAVLEAVEEAKAED